MIRPKCPRCVVDLKRDRANGANYSHCEKCFGMSLTVPVLKKTVDGVAVTRLWLEAWQAKRRSEIKCPYCRKVMRTLVAPIPEGPELDVCTSCYAVWLDHGEMEQLPKIKGEGSVVELEEARKKLSKHEIQALIDVEEAKAEKGDSTFEVESSTPGGYKTFLTIIGLPVEKHDDYFKTQPIITWALILMCVVVSYFAFNDRSLMKDLQFLPSSDIFHWLFNGVSTFFVHGGWMHLLGNMYFLWIFGDNVEDEIGKTKYILLVALSTLAGAWAYGYIAKQDIPVVGASGGVSGLMAFYLLRFPRRKFMVMFFFRWFTISAWALVGFYILADIFGVFKQVNGLTNVSHISHSAGALVGALFALVIAPQYRDRMQRKMMKK